MKHKQPYRFTSTSTSSRRHRLGKGKGTGLLWSILLPAIAIQRCAITVNATITLPDTGAQYASVLESDFGTSMAIGVEYVGRLQKSPSFDDPYLCTDSNADADADADTHGSIKGIIVPSDNTPGELLLYLIGFVIVIIVVVIGFDRVHVEKSRVDWSWNWIWVLQFKWSLEFLASRLSQF